MGHELPWDYRGEGTVRADAVGLFWQDLPKPPPEKRTPPPRTWEEPDYLPRLEEAREVSARIAVAVAGNAYDTGVATNLPRPKDLYKTVVEAMWKP